MIPQCDPSILEANPRFKALHQLLTTSILNPDGTTRVVSEDPERLDVQTVSLLTRSSEKFN